MALGADSATGKDGKVADWREVVSAIKEAGKVFEKAPDYRTLRYPYIIFTI
jgi:hypothetical protein